MIWNTARGAERPQHLFHHFKPEGEFHLSPVFFPRTFVIEHSTKVSAKKTLVKQNKTRVVFPVKEQARHAPKRLGTKDVFIFFLRGVVGSVTVLCVAHELSFAYRQEHTFEPFQCTKLQNVLMCYIIGTVSSVIFQSFLQWRYNRTM